MNALRPYPWQLKEWGHFQKLLAEDRLAHAIMLTGLRGLGKEQFAHLFAQSIFCLSPSAEGIPCGQCASCHQFQAETLTDFRHVSPEEGVTTITVDQIRGTIDFLELSHEEGRRKIALVSPADWMNVNAANSVLKTLEEPAGDALIILIASQPERLPVTIRSRCQVVHFETPELEEGEAWLVEQGHSDAGLALAIVGGAPISAKELLTDQGGTSDFLAVLEGIIGTVSGNKSSHEVVSSWSSYDTETLLNWMVLVSEWFIHLSMGLAVKAVEKQSLYQTLSQLAGGIDPKSLMVRHEKLLKLKQRRGVSLNHELLLDHLQLLWSGRL